MNKNSINRENPYEKYIQPILEGDKKQIICKNHNLKVGCEINLSNYVKGNLIVIPLIITKIRIIRFDELEQENAKLNGYKHVGFLKYELFEDYGNLADSELLYEISFKLKEQKKSVDEFNSIVDDNNKIIL